MDTVFRVLRLAAFTSLALLVAFGAYAQTGRIGGKVEDQQGAFIAQSVA